MGEGHDYDKKIVPEILFWGLVICVPDAPWRWSSRTADRASIYVIP